MKAVYDSVATLIKNEVAKDRIIEIIGSALTSSLPEYQRGQINLEKIRYFFDVNRSTHISFHATPGDRGVKAARRRDAIYKFLTDSNATALDPVIVTDAPPTTQ